MKDSTIAAWQIVPPAEGYVFDLGSWYERCDQLPDGRNARGKR